MAAVYENQSTDFYCRGDKNYRSQLHCSPHIHYHIEIVQILEEYSESKCNIAEEAVSVTV